ncbi:beta-1,4-N-acetyl-galactosaminyltransferase 1 [Chelydra serpentina]|uniref:Beta-1,4-N-acetyl-galactosaminyltransferase 1 n=1 Tax=Chelydra serpentina TaxID=8475 RepID=A0A8T1SCR7_CHESE|nr:beta-1,4-N-acetyl-galactosaminyltransferase 1 [Chelydra serpentina]
MRLAQKSLCLLLVATASLALLYLHVRSPKPYSTVDLRNRPGRAPEQLLGEPLLGPSNKYAHIPFRLKEEIVALLPRNSCSCEVAPGGKLPFPKQLFGQLYSLDFAAAFGPAELTRIRGSREQEYQSYRHRTQSPADQLLIVRANSPLEYPAQGVEVRPLRTILIPGLSLQAASSKLYKVRGHAGGSPREEEGTTLRLWLALWGAG